MTRRVLALECAILLVLALVMWGISYFRITYGTPTYELDLIGGSIGFCRSSDYVLGNDHLEPGWRCYGFRSQTYWMRHWRRGPWTWSIGLPLWIPTVIFGTLCAYLYVPIWRRQRRARVGACLYCGYNLTGNLSGVCPECGGAVFKDESTARIGKGKVVALVLTPILIVAGPMVFLTIKNAMGEPDESLVQRVYRICTDQGEYSLWFPQEMDQFIDQARHFEGTREELMAYWEEENPVSRYVPDCFNAAIDAGFDIAERWDGRPESERVKTAAPDEEEER